MSHPLSDASYSPFPLLRWQYLDRAATRIHVAGALTAHWSGMHGIGSPVGVDLAVVHDQAAIGSMRVLLAKTLHKPTPVESEVERLDVPLDLYVEVRPRDSIFISIRAQESTGHTGRWVGFTDARLEFRECRR